MKEYVSIDDVTNIIYCCEGRDSIQLTMRKMQT